MKPVLLLRGSSGAPDRHSIRDSVRGLLTPAGLGMLSPAVLSQLEEDEEEPATHLAAPLCLLRLLWSGLQDPYTHLRLRRPLSTLGNVAHTPHAALRAMMVADYAGGTFRGSVCLAEAAHQKALKFIAAALRREVESGSAAAAQAQYEANLTATPVVTSSACPPWSYIQQAQAAAAAALTEPLWPHQVAALAWALYMEKEVGAFREAAGMTDGVGRFYSFDEVAAQPAETRGGILADECTGKRRVMLGLVAAGLMASEEKEADEGEAAAAAAEEDGISTEPPPARRRRVLPALPGEAVWQRGARWAPCPPRQPLACLLQAAIYGGDGAGTMAPTTASQLLDPEPEGVSIIPCELVTHAGTLVVVPSHSSLEYWKAECQAKLPSVKVVEYAGTERLRRLVHSSGGLLTAGIVLTTYATLAQDLKVAETMVRQHASVRCPAQPFIRLGAAAAAAAAAAEADGAVVAYATSLETVADSNLWPKLYLRLEGQRLLRLRFEPVKGVAFQAAAADHLLVSCTGFGEVEEAVAPAEVVAVGTLAQCDSTEWPLAANKHRCKTCGTARFAHRVALRMNLPPLHQFAWERLVLDGVSMGALRQTRTRKSEAVQCLVAKYKWALTNDPKPAELPALFAILGVPHARRWQGSYSHFICRRSNEDAAAAGGLPPWPSLSVRTITLPAAGHQRLLANYAALYPASSELGLVTLMLKWAAGAGGCCGAAAAAAATADDALTSSCPVCFDAAADRVQPWTCGHQFCGSCALRLVVALSPCPMCRCKVVGQVGLAQCGVALSDQTANAKLGALADHLLAEEGGGGRSRSTTAVVTKYAQLIPCIVDGLTAVGLDAAEGAAAAAAASVSVLTIKSALQADLASINNIIFFDAVLPHCVSRLIRRSRRQELVSITHLVQGGSVEAFMQLCDPLLKTLTEATASFLLTRLVEAAGPP